MYSSKNIKEYNINKKIYNEKYKKYITHQVSHALINQFFKYNLIEVTRSFNYYSQCFYNYTNEIAHTHW